MTNFIKTIAITTTILGASVATAQASDTFTARFDYNASQSASTNLERFEQTAKTVCDAQMKAAGFRKSEGRFERRQCQKTVVAKAVKATKNDTLVAAYKAHKSGTRSSVTQIARVGN